MRVDEFDFDLPTERIALAPAEPRDASRLLHIRPDGACVDEEMRRLPQLLAPGDMLVVNDTKVIPAQLTGVRPARAVGGGGDVNIDVTLHKMVADGVWRAFVRPAKRLRIGDRVIFSETLMGDVVAREDAEAELHFNLKGAAFASALAAVGAPPLPPYIARRRAADAADVERYQTIYARAEGSVAAPTAGLHFTGDVFSALEERNVLIEKVTLHVGAGTFLPVTAEDTSDHKMHAEWGVIGSEQATRINAAKASGAKVVAVGTTSLRLLESAAREDGRLGSFEGETDIFITPGYEFKIADRLLTNFHLPRSTLFMLVCAFSGTRTMKNAYAHAIENEYRFYSYGDACLLERRS